MAFGLGFGLQRSTIVGLGPYFTVSPTISGTPTVGQNLTVSYTVAGTPTTITRNWYRGATLIFTSTSSNVYPLVQADAGNTSNISCQVVLSPGGATGISNTIAQIMDANAEAYLNVIAIPNDGTVYFPSTIFQKTGAEQWAAANDLFIELKAANVYSKLNFYPLMGGTFNTQKYNGRDPADTDAAFRLVTVGTNTYDGSGYTSNGVNSAMRSRFTPSIHCVNINSGAFAVYSRTSRAVSTTRLIGCNSGSAYFGGYLFYTGSQMYASINDNNSNFKSITTTKAFLQASRNNSSTQVNMGQDANITAININSTSLVTNEFVFNALGTGAATQTNYDNLNIAFQYTCGNALSISELTQINTIVVKFMTALGRQN